MPAVPWRDTVCSVGLGFIVRNCCENVGELGERVKGMRLVRLQLLERAQLLSACLCGVCAGRMVSREEMLRCNAEASSHSACAVAAISAWLPVGVWWHV